MTEVRAALFIAGQKWLAEKCRNCDHPRRRHLYAEGLCVHTERRVHHSQDGTVVATSGVRYCHCPTFQAKGT